MRMVEDGIQHQQPTFYTRVWRTTSTSDIALCTEDIQRIIEREREVGNQLGGSDHRHVYLTIAVKTVSAPVLPRWNIREKIGYCTITAQVY